MAQGRPEIQTALRRAVLVEAGHRCAIPTCRQAPVDVAHINPWAKVKEHKFENLIALCPTCHARFDRGDIDKRSILQYKANLDVLNHRYSDIERLVLRTLYTRVIEGVALAIPTAMGWMVMDLEDDGLIEFEIATDPVTRQTERELNESGILLTPKGRDFMQRWFKALPIDGS
ncbi:HNH endonuclease signature motif containing protein [Streptomyces rhizosphaericus]|uniref:HNH endonuclease signature motif containing protein n=1 Tax=Streptomyces rhizosphaericus TaxID=114699 RepID=UPI00142D66E6|nr:HNH endonuclease signature motif containing protein [Streptomyces rhizosphaericus]